MHRTSRSISLALILAAVSVLAGCLDGNTPDCGHPHVSLNLPAGTCQAIANSCGEGGVWLEGEGLTLDSQPLPPYFHVEMTHPADASIGMQICADPANQPVPHLVYLNFLYSTPTDDRAGVATFDINTAPPLQVAVTAVPDTVVPGQSVVLEAKPNGGLPPYSYQWVPADGVSGQEQVVTAAPTVTTAYQVTVTDSLGAQQQAFAKVLVVASHCGDGIVESPAETCDDGNTKSGDGCSSTCTLETACQVDSGSCINDAQCCSGSCSTKTQRCTAGT